LFGLIAPAAAGIMLVTRPMVELMISEQFQAVTIAVLPLAALAGAVRNLRIHFCDQIFILFERTDLNILINIVEAIGTVVFCFVGVVYAGLPGAAAGCLAGSTISSLFGFALGVRRFGLVIPWDHVARVSAATAVMTSVLMLPAIAQLAAPPLTRVLVDGAIGGAVYGLALAALYPCAVRLLALRLRAPRPAAD
jgi:O-antigen/teichoic acid export membrane protein